MVSNTYWDGYLVAQSMAKQERRGGYQARELGGKIAKAGRHADQIGGR